MAAAHKTGVLPTTEELAKLLKTRRITGKNGATAFHNAMRLKSFSVRWEQLWSDAAQSMGGQMELATVINIVKEVASRAGLPQGWNTTAALAAPALEALVSCGRFDGFSGWLFASPTPEAEQEECAEAMAA